MQAPCAQISHLLLASIHDGRNACALSSFGSPLEVSSLLTEMYFPVLIPLTSSTVL